MYYFMLLFHYDHELPKSEKLQITQFRTKYFRNVVDRHAGRMTYDSSLVELWPFVAIQGGTKFPLSRNNHELKNSSMHQIQSREDSFKNVLNAPQNEHDFPELSWIIC